MQQRPWHLNRFVERRESFLIGICEQLDSDCKATLALVYMRRSKLLSPVELAPAELQALQRHGSDLGGCTAALEVLDGSFLTHSISDGDSFWSFKHPTIGEAYAAILRKSPELLGIYVQGTDVDKLMREVTCGDMQIQGAVILPRSLFPLMATRMRGFRGSSSYKSDHLSEWDARRQIRHFLAERCSTDFFEAYLRADPGVIEGIDRPGVYLEVNADIALAIRMHTHGMLPDAVRESLVSFAVECVKEGGDPRILVDASFRALMTSEELSRLENDIRTTLLPNIEEVRLAIQALHQEGEGDAAWHMRRFQQSLNGIADHFHTSRRIRTLVNRQTARTQEWIELREQLAKKNRESTSHAISVTGSSAENTVGSRSIFDDIAE